MKSNSLFGFLINPFTRIAGWQAFAIGLLVLLITSVVGAYSGVVFDGVFDMHLMELTLEKALLIQAVSVASLVLVMWVTAMLVSKTFRFIDILGTMTLARAPYILLAIAGFFTTTPDVQEMMKDPFSIFSSVSFIVVMVLSLPVIVWNITLMYNALKISCDIKGSKLTIAFILAVIIAEIVSKTVLFLLNMVQIPVIS